VRKANRVNIEFFMTVSLLVAISTHRIYHGQRNVVTDTKVSENNER
jgi:hypothetical protein